MNRRSFLAFLGSTATLSVAGCTRAGSTSSPDTDQRVVRLDTVDDLSAEHDVEMTVELLQSRIDSEQTARLAVSTTNRGECRALSVAPEMCALFNRNQGGSDHPEELWLHRAGTTDVSNRDGDRWVADRPSDDPRAYPAYACLPHEYDTGETVRNEYELWDDYRVDGYMEPGTYRWEETVRMFSPDGDHGGDEEDVLGSFQWGFDIEVPSLRTPDEPRQSSANASASTG